MTTDDLKAKENKIFEEYDRDGAAETILGFALLVAGAYLADHEAVGMGAILPILIILIAKAWKKRITYPRLGYVEFGTLRKTQRRKSKWLVLIGSFTAMALALAVVLLRDDIASTHATRYIFGSAIFFILLLMVWVKRKPILLIAPLLFGLLLLATGYFEQRPYWAFWGTGIVMFVWGIARLILFLRRNPLIKKEAVHGEI